MHARMSLARSFSMGVPAASDDFKYLSGTEVKTFGLVCRHVPVL